MISDLFWLFVLLALEVVVFLIVLFLVRTFTRSHDQEWPTQEAVPASLDEHANPAA
jgi:hypothetical protein